MISGNTILLTGGAGSVAKALIPQLLEQDPETLRILDNNEPGLAEIQSRIDDERCRYLAGDVRDKDRLERAMEDVDVVIHTAAMKHVDVCEYNPFEAVKTNTVGLQNIVDTSIDANVDRVVFTSSDKAVNPANTMGTTKLLGEKLITAGNYHRGDRDILFAAVRFGNIINSSRSVIPIFTDQIRDGGPVTLTDERMTRFFLTYDDVFDLVSQAIEKTNGGEVFVYKMPAIKIKNLAQAMIETLAPQFGHDPDEIEMDVIGRRTGETFHEEIMTEREARRARENDSLYAVPPEMTDIQTDGGNTEFEDTSNIILSSKDAPKLSKDEIVELLSGSDVIPEATEGDIDLSSKDQSVSFSENNLL